MVTIPSSGSVRLTQTIVSCPSSILVNTPGEDIIAAKKFFVISITQRHNCSNKQTEWLVVVLPLAVVRLIHPSVVKKARRNWVDTPILPF